MRKRERDEKEKMRDEKENEMMRWVRNEMSSDENDEMRVLR